ncbi:hypothetical protein [Legionella bononiensis]|uniref:Phosphatase n=1 Tax=Legionella bononiensis TaxID=2793102 RepID=A0ABS1WF63_9GAMM|nr:hypothetical protein [Legionella bononiensis]MBL7479274.1 hypothetical protein [Legionella bononiensis]MBL7527998.1 hypothetical protein [Legionella bononiensis]MBL7563925.1 hypothetical protein [Legionella bononiensis]
MGKLNAGGMAAIETERAKRSDEIRTLVSKPFDSSNVEQLNTLKKYIDDFENSANYMYVYQALSNGMKAWGASFVVARFLPIPDFINPILSACLYFGVSGFILERFSISDFYNQLTEMKHLYNWCLKNGNAHYDERIDNTQNLLNPDIQRMIKLMAPLCTTEYMMAWPKEAERVEENPSLISSAFSFGYSLITSPSSFFQKSPQPSGDQQLRLHDLKISVETRRLDLNAYAGFKQAIDYFMTSVTNTDYKALLWSKWDDLKKMAPTPVTALLTSPKMD